MDTWTRYSPRWSVVLCTQNSRNLTSPLLACCVAFIALLLSFSQHITITLVASLVSFLAALITLVAFAINIALFAYVKHELGTLNISETTITGPGWFFLFLSSLLVSTLRQVFGSHS